MSKVVLLSINKDFFSLKAGHCPELLKEGPKDKSRKNEARERNHRPAQGVHLGEFIVKFHTPGGTFDEHSSEDKV